MQHENILLPQSPHTDVISSQCNMKISCYLNLQGVPLEWPPSEGRGHITWSHTYHMITCIPVSLNGYSQGFVQDESTINICYMTKWEKVMISLTSQGKEKSSQMRLCRTFYPSSLHANKVLNPVKKLKPHLKIKWDPFFIGRTRIWTYGLLMRESWSMPSSARS